LTHTFSSFRKRTIFFARGLCWQAFFALALLPCAALSPQNAQAARQIPASQLQDALPCKPFLEWMLDPGGHLGIQDISAPERQSTFAPLDMRFPPHQSGTLWLRFTLSQRTPESRPATLLLDMGDDLPGAPLLFTPKSSAPADAAEWRSIEPSRQSIFLLPETQGAPQTMYIRLEGLPSPWFTPMLRTPHNAATTPERMIQPAILVALGVVMLLCLLRWLTERGQWRIWISLYTGATLAYAVYGMPAAPEGAVLLRDLPGVLAPGIALMLLPHAGRHLMQTHDKAHGLDFQYRLLSLPGMALALLPLVPNLAWTSYYLAFWPLATALFIPTSLGAWLSGLPGSRRFLLACLVSMTGATIGILGMYAFVSSPLLPAAPLLGVALGALFIAATDIPKDYAFNDDEQPKGHDPKDHEREYERGALKIQDTPEWEEPGLRLLPPEEIAAPQPPEAPPEPPQSAAPTPQTPTPAPLFSARDAESTSSLEGRLRPHLDALLRESAGIAVCALPPVARQHADAMAHSGRAIASLLGSGPPGAALERSPAHTVFDLQQLLREAHDQMAEEAERKGLNISWFMPPHLPPYYAGNAGGISQVIRLLLESSVRATQQGFVQLTVRRVPDSVNPGHLLFSISDSGAGMPPHARNSLALARAWELAGAQGGSMSAESGVQGAIVSFTLQLKPLSDLQAETDVTVQAGRVIVIDELSSNRQLLAFFLEGLPCVIEEARSIDEAAQACRTERAALLLIDCDTPETENLDALRSFLAWEHERDLPATPVLALESAGGIWQSLGGLGHVHRLAKPVTRSGLREAVLGLLPRPAPSAPGTDVARPADGAPDAEPPLDLPPPVEYGPGLAPRDGQFVPLSLDQTLAFRSPPSAPVASASLQASGRPPASLPAFPPESDAVYGAHAPPAYASPHTAAAHYGEWVGEPVPAPRAQGHASLLRPFDRQAAQPNAMGEDAWEEADGRPASFPSPQQAGLLDWVDGARPAQAVPPPRHAPEHAALPAAYGAHARYEYHIDEWVGEPVPAPRAAPVPRAAAPPPRPYAAHAVPGPERDEFIPLRLTDPPRTFPQPPPAAPQAPAEPVPLFPEDNSLLGFVLGRPGKDAQKHAAAPQRPTRLAQAARDLVQFVRTRTDVPLAEAKRNMPESQRETPRAAQAPSFAEQPEPAELRKTEPAAPGRPADALADSAVEQMQPLIPGLLSSLDEAMDDVRRAFRTTDTSAVEEAAARIASRADNYGLRILARMARCVEMAAKAHDKDALANILPDLETAVERNRIALQPKK
jgi:CheY-like chemotaxis protein/HPt (histidine-containing phosphotransfer) domain-containing protein